MSGQPLFKPAILMLAIVVISLLSWELYLRNCGVSIDYDDGPPNWADKRAMVYEPSDKTVVFIGSSRIKFDLDLDTWQDLTGTYPVMLAIEGNSPRPVLDDLADDPKFNGRLVIDVTEGLFFSNSPHDVGKPKKNIQYYKDQTPAQWAGFQLNYPLESQFVFLDEDNFSLNAMLDQLEIPSRPGVFMFPIFPREFNRKTFGRQSKMSDSFLADTSQQNKVRGIWAFFRKIDKSPPIADEGIAEVLASVKTATDKIKARGGEVLFVRTPSSGPFLIGEAQAFARERFWNPLLATTGCTGIHFADYPGMSHFECPEFSHLTPKDAVLFTRELVTAMKQDKGWKFLK